MIYGHDNRDAQGRAINSEVLPLSGAPTTMDRITPPRRRGRPSKGGREPVKQVPESVSRTIDDFLGPLPLLEGEDRVAYLGLLEEVRRQVAPKDVIEQIYVRDVVDLTWELMRARRLKVGLLHKGQVAAIKRLLPSLNTGGSGGFVGQLAKAKATAGFSEGLMVLEKHGITLNELNAHAFATERESITRLDQAMMQIEARRNFALREIDKRREAFARRLGEGIRQVEAEFKIIPEGSSSESVIEP